jgi:hypothetical protein
MVKAYSICLLVLFTVCSFGLYAEDTAMPPAQEVVLDPTIAFFSALSTCSPGNYAEKNDLEGNVGQTWLSQIIIGQDEGACNVTLSTPDGRVMNCAFPMTSLSTLMDQQFLQGSADNNSIAADKNAVNADVVWSQLKTDHCHFIAPETSQ